MKNLYDDEDCTKTSFPICLLRNDDVSWYADNKALKAMLQDNKTNNKEAIVKTEL